MEIKKKYPLTLHDLETLSLDVCHFFPCLIFLSFSYIPPTAHPSGSQESFFKRSAKPLSSLPHHLILLLIRPSASYTSLPPLTSFFHTTLSTFSFVSYILFLLRLYLSFILSSVYIFHADYQYYCSSPIPLCKLFFSLSRI